MPTGGDAARISIASRLLPLLALTARLGIIVTIATPPHMKAQRMKPERVAEILIEEAGRLRYGIDATTDRAALLRHVRAVAMRLEVMGGTLRYDARGYYLIRPSPRRP